MAKRFSDSLKWDDPFFSELSNDYKLLWIYMLDKCDHAGMFKVNKRMAEFCLNTKFDWKAVEGVFKGRVQTLNDEKWYIPKFIEYQYGELSEANRVHSSIIRILEKEGVYKVRRRSVLGLKEQEKDKDKDLDKDKDILNRVLSYWNEKMPNKIQKLSEKRKESLRIRLKDSDFAYKVIIDKIAASDFLTGKTLNPNPKHKNWKADIDWLIANDNNYLKVLEGKYDNNGTSTPKRDLKDYTNSEGGKRLRALKEQREKAKNTVNAGNKPASDDNEGF